MRYRPARTQRGRAPRPVLAVNISYLSERSLERVEISVRYPPDPSRRAIDIMNNSWVTPFKRYADGVVLQSVEHPRG